MVILPAVAIDAVILTTEKPRLHGDCILSGIRFTWNLVLHSEPYCSNRVVTRWLSRSQQKLDPR